MLLKVGGIVARGTKLQSLHYFWKRKNQTVLTARCTCLYMSRRETEALPLDKAAMLLLCFCIVANEVRTTLKCLIFQQSLTGSQFASLPCLCIVFIPRQLHCNGKELTCSEPQSKHWIPKLQEWHVNGCLWHLFNKSTHAFPGNL